MKISAFRNRKALHTALLVFILVCALGSVLLTALLARDVHDELEEHRGQTEKVIAEIARQSQEVAAQNEKEHDQMRRYIECIVLLEPSEESSLKELRRCARESMLPNNKKTQKRSNTASQQAVSRQAQNTRATSTTTSQPPRSSTPPTRKEDPPPPPPPTLLQRVTKPVVDVIDFVREL